MSKEIEPAIRVRIQNFGMQCGNGKSNEAWDRGCMDEPSGSAHSARLAERLMPIHRIGQMVEGPSHQDGVERVIGQVKVTRVPHQCLEGSVSSSRGHVVRHGIDHHDFVPIGDQRGGMHASCASNIEHTRGSRGQGTDNLLSPFELQPTLGGPGCQPGMLIEKVGVVRLDRVINGLLAHVGTVTAIQPTKLNPSRAPTVEDETQDAEYGSPTTYRDRRYLGVP